MALRVVAIAACLLLSPAGSLRSEEPEEVELTSSSGLTIGIDQDYLIVDPERPFIWCSTIEDPIPVYIDSDAWEYATLGEFKPHLDSSPDWAGLKNKSKLLSGPKAMTGRKLGLRKKTPAVLTLNFLLKNSDLRKVEKWCEDGTAQAIYLLKFTISVEDRAGKGKHVDPGVGVKRGG